jgi:hypothetical protein
MLMRLDIFWLLPDEMQSIGIGQLLGLHNPASTLLGMSSGLHTRVKSSVSIECCDILSYGYI